MYLFLFITLASVAALSKDVCSIPIYTPYIPFVVVMVLYLKQRVVSSKKTLRRREEYIFVFSQILILLLALISIDPQEAFPKSITALYAAALYLVTRHYLQTGAIRSSNVVVFFSCALTVLMLVGLLQVVMRNNIGVVATYFGDNLSQGAYESDFGGVRISGTYTNPNVFAQAMALYAGIVIAVLLFYKRRPRFFLALMISGITTFLVASSLSRSGLMFSFLVQVAVYGFWVMRGGRHRFQRFALFAMLIFSLFVVVLVSVSFVGDEPIPGISRFTSVENDDVAITGRINSYLAALQLLGDPGVLLFGVGAGQFYESAMKHGINLEYKSWIAPEDNFGSVHNWILMIVTEHGLIVLLLYIYAICKTVSRGWFLRKLPRGWLPASLAIVIAMLYLSAFQVGTTGTTVWLLTPVVIMLAWIQNEYDQICSAAGASTKVYFDCQRRAPIGEAVLLRMKCGFNNERGR